MTMNHAPGRLTVLAALLASIAAPVFAAPSDLVISQVYGGGGNTGATYKYDFVELFNRGTSDIALGGKSLQYASATGSTWGVASLPAKTLKPGQFFMMQLQGGSGGVVWPVTPDGSSTSINLSGTTGKILLSSGTTALTGTNPTAGVMDLVGWGTGANHFEGAPAPGTTNATALVRSTACSDNDSNSTEFLVQAPSPRTMALDPAPCGGGQGQPIVAVCPANFSVQHNTAGSAALSASDADSRVNAAAITSTNVPGIYLAGFNGATSAGDSATVSLAVDAGVPVGNYPVAVNFSNDDAQSKSCNVEVRVQGLAGISRTIPQIQGSGATSPVAESVQTTEGVITHKIGNSFFMQDPNGDGDSTTSDGIYVFMGNTPTNAAVGDLVRVTGTVTEYKPTNATRSITEFKDTTSILVRSSGHTITPTNIDSLANLDRVEGMLVNFTNALTVNQNAWIAVRGELTLSMGRRETPTNRFRPGSADALALEAANSANQITLDDNSFEVPAKIPYIADDRTVRTGDSVTGLTGVIDFGAVGGGTPSFKLQPTIAPVFSRSNPRTAGPELPAGNVKVASANVLNFFTTFTNGADAFGATSGQGCTLGSTTRPTNCRGADNMAEFVRQRDKIVHSLKAIDADVVGLMEIQNNGDDAVTYLVQQLNLAYGSPVYEVVPRPAVLGTDAIRVAMIYKPAKVARVGGALSDGDDVNNRPPMAQTFKAVNGGGKFSLIVNHLKSKSCSGASGANADQKDGQSCFNADRIDQATRLANVFIPQVVAAAGDPDVLVIGDMNSHGFEDPINILTGKGLVNELERHVRPVTQPYSYVFGGLAAYLDHALATPSLDAQVIGATEWHNNADEPEVIDYNIGGKPEDLYVSNAYRASDHDPVVVALDLASTYADVTGSFTTKLAGPAFNRVTGKFTGTMSFTNKTGAAINGPFHVSFAGLPAGVTLDNASGQLNGVPYITSNTASIAAGATVTVSMTFSNPAKTGISFTNAIYSGAF